MPYLLSTITPWDIIGTNIGSLCEIIFICTFKDRKIINTIFLVGGHEVDFIEAFVFVCTFPHFDI